MSALYITEHGASIGVVNERIQVRRKGKVVQEMPALHLERLVLMVPAYITLPAIHFLMDRGIDISYLSQNGKFYGQFTRGDGAFVELRLAQYDKFHQQTFRLYLARTFIAGKVNNMIRLWHRQRRHGNLKLKVDRLLDLLRKIQNAGSLPSLLGLEGAATAAHFSLLRQCLHDDWKFERRIPHPPPDPINAILSLGYTLLYSRMAGMLQMHGLDPYLGFFHEPKRGHASLASDMIEEWRCPAVDTVILRMLNNREITPQDFKHNGNQCRMERPALEKFVHAYEQRLLELQALAAEQDSKDLVSGLEGQVRQLARMLLGKQKEYTPIAG